MKWNKDYQRNYNHNAPKNAPKTPFLIFFETEKDNITMFQRDAWSMFYAMNNFKEDFSEQLQEYFDKYRPEKVKVLDVVLQEEHEFRYNESAGRYCWHNPEVDELLKGGNKNEA